MKCDKQITLWMMHLLRKAALIVAAMIGSAIIVSILVVLALSLTPYGIQPQEMLPPETSAILIGSDSALLPLWQTVTNDASITANHAAIAFLTPETGSAGIITFDRKEEGTDYESTVGSFGIRFSDMALQHHVRQSGKALSSDARFRLLASRLPRNTSWLFLRKQVIPLPKTPTDIALFGALIGTTAEAMGISRIENGWMANIYDTHVSDLRWNAPTTVPYMENPILILSTANASAAIQETLSALPANTSAILEGLIAKRMADFFGTALSMEYDIRPLLERPTSVQLSSSGGGVQFLLTGSMDIGSDLTASMARLHDIYDDTLPTAHVIRRTPDPRFPSSDVRDDPALIRQSEEILQEWTVHDTSSENGRVFVTAVRGSQYMMSNDLSSVRRAITMPVQQPNFPETGTQGTAFVAGGQANMPALERLIRTILPDAPFTELPLRDTMQWSIERSGKLRSVVLKAMMEP